jgi:molybdate transport system ATP-binding protein
MIELRDVRVILGGKIVLDDINWTLRSGEHWLLSGPNGSGKTTFLRVVRGDQPIAHGAGRRIFRLSGSPEADALASAKSRIGYLSPELHERMLRMELPLSTRELILGGLEGTLYLAAPATETQHERVATLAERLGLTAILDEPMIELSFGQLRRALLARALASAPRVVVLDEFAHGVDRRSRRVIADALSEAIREGSALVVATHRREELPREITHELRLKEGRIAETGALSKVPLRARSESSRNGSPARDATAAILRLENVDVFQEHRAVLRSIDWEIRGGEHWHVSGPNGAGKSTLAKLLYGRLRTAYGGAIERFGSRANTSVAKIRRDVALISDDEQLRYDWNIPVESVVVSGFFASVGLLREPSSEQREAARRLIEDFGLEPLARARFLELSFGQRRLVLVARALVRTPKLLILDEALNGFDEDARERILRRVRELAVNGTSVVMIGHHQSDIPAWIDNELRLEEGRVVFKGRC